MFFLMCSIAMDYSPSSSEWMSFKWTIGNSPINGSTKCLAGFLDPKSIKFEQGFWQSYSHILCKSHHILIYAKSGCHI